jgi:hypothetical protein
MENMGNIWKNMGKCNILKNNYFMGCILGLVGLPFAVFVIRNINHLLFERVVILFTN